MENPKIQPEKITKPIQLLAVWFAGLVLLVGLLLAGAKTIQEPKWLVPVLAISAVLIIPVFLYYVFLLQTKYRPQMQEDTFYSKYLDSSTNTTVVVTEESKIDSSVIMLQNQILELAETNRIYQNRVDQFMKDKSAPNSSEATDIDNYIKTSNENFVKFEQNVKKTQFPIQINTLLSNFSEYYSAITKSGFENVEAFTGGGGGKLERQLISIGNNVDPNFVYELLLVALPLGLELINVINTGVEQEMRKNDIVVGSHAFNLVQRVTLELDSVFMEKLSVIKTKKELHSMFK
ncbi:MAG: hypothetical protein V4619_13320 [Bacteroidota bacterium]